MGREQPPLSGNGVLKLLAWTVADARGATTLLDKSLALTVGKRLDRQAESVRAKLQGILGRWRDERARIHLEAHSNAGMKALLEGFIESALESEKAELYDARTEVYIGFHELESLLQEEEDAEPERAPAPAPVPAPEVQLARQPAVHFPWLLELDEEPWAGCPIPPDLLAALYSTEAVDLLWEQSREWACPPETGADWWSHGLPRFAARLVLELRLQREVSMRTASQHCEDLARLEAELETANQSREKAYAGWNAADEEIAEVEGQLREAKGREDALHEVIRRCRWG